MGKAVLVAFLIIFGVGFAVGSKTGSDPQVRVETIRVPEVVTHVETKEVVRTEQLPEACTTLVRQLQDVQKYNLATNEAASKMFDLAGKRAMRLGTNDIAAYNKILRELIVAQGDLDVAVTSSGTAQANITNGLARCVKASQQQ